MRKSFWHRYDVNDRTAETPKIRGSNLRRREVLTALLNSCQPNNGVNYSLLGIKDPSVVYGTIKSPLQQAMDQAAI